MTSDSAPEDPRPKVEIGWIMAGAWDPRRRRTVSEAADAMGAYLARALPSFDWRVVVVEHPSATPTDPLEPVLLLDEAEAERDRYGWDFVFVITDRRLVSYTREALAMPARIFSTAIVSTDRLTAAEDGDARLEARLFPLTMHLLGRLCDLAPREADTFMREIERVVDLDEMDGFEPEEIESLGAYLEQVADPRVEEMPGAGRNQMLFYLRALWENRRGLPRAIVRMRPWSFPARLNRLTTAAGSALVVLIMTAESWEVAANLSENAVALISLGAIVATSIYLLRAQRLLTPSSDRTLSEQRAVSNTGTAIAVCIGMGVSYLAILAVALAIGALIFGDGLLSSWTDAEAPASLRPRMAAFVAALSLAIGALGASFEPRGYFRHVTHIDAEI